MKNLLVFIFLTIISFTVLGNTPKTTLEEYIETWKEVAINQMHTHGIPASITLSQGILESGFGNSKLAVQANNHFGIKCHDWTGDTFLKDDDKRNECFRKYRDAAHSFEDHSAFLTSRTRYSSLFELEITDYKAWAKGLKTAGYATNPTYDKKLIELIQRYDLDQYDKASPIELIASNKSDQKIKLVSKHKSQETNSTAIQQIKSAHQVYTNQNRTRYIVAGNHDTFYQIAKEFGVSIHQLNRWNDFPPSKDVLKEGDKVYIMRKRKKIGENLAQIQVKDPHKLWEISQEYGVQMKALAELNKLTSPNIALNK
ncbi:MAG TPA: glucosaminidase domain-containing protein [Brumimicrobium sp.]|nr:glucosaminidase domain-containing protein [Brumimicrobium sp.]